MNQCDGCQRGLPLVDTAFGGKFHKGNSWIDSISCTADRYEDEHANHIDTAVAQSLATEHAGHHLLGGHTVCPYREGTPERAAYMEQWKRLMRLAGEL